MPQPSACIELRGYGSTYGATISDVAKISISLEDELYERVRDAAGPEGVSGWLAAAASGRLRADALRAVAEEIAHDTGGPFTEQELSEAHRWLPSSSTPAR
jgi:hypothetical protein